MISCLRLRALDLVELLLNRDAADGDGRAEGGAEFPQPLLHRKHHLRFTDGADVWRAGLPPRTNSLRNTELNESALFQGYISG